MDDLVTALVSALKVDLSAVCPINIPPESSGLCSAGYCGACQLRRLTDASKLLKSRGWQRVPEGYAIIQLASTQPSAVFLSAAPKPGDAND